MTRKSQVQSQMFIYILTLLVIGLLLYFGIKWIGAIISTQEIIDSTKFKIDLENAFEKIRSNYGSKDRKEFLAPEGVDRVCFVDSQLFIPTRELTGLCKSVHDDYDPIMCNEWTSNTTAVVFAPIIETDIDIGAIDVDTTSRYLCFNTSSSRRISLTLTGLGNKVKVARQ